MAMTVRFSPDVDARLQQIADARHTSKHAIVLQAVEDFMETATKTDRVMQSVERTLVRDAELLARLEDS
ncbi:MAG: ribbon-helix-helix protein, CopG family [Cryobacterium sp.]|nr:ribbon-helix-helix protein, CopG family [Cryobacterium sp.]